MEAMAVAAANYQTPQPIVETLNFETERVNRYVWYAGEDLPWPEIKGGYIKRCRVAPIVPFLIWERIGDVPEDMRLRVRREWMDKSYTEAEYEIRPSAIFESIMTQYGHLGVGELTRLKGMSEQQVASLNLDAIFSPWHDDAIPKAYKGIEDHIRKTLNESVDPILRSVGEDMLKSIIGSRAYDEQFVDIVESQKELKYSHPAFRALSRLDRRRRDTALNDMAAAQNKVFDKVPEILAAQGSSDNSALIGVMQEQNAMLREELAQNREMMKALLAERQADKPSRTRKPAQVDA